LYALRVNDLQDDEINQEMAIDFDYGVPELLAVRKLLGTRMLTKTKFTCTTIGASEASRKDFTKKLKENPELIESLGKELSIFGYDPNLIDPEIKYSNSLIATEPVDMSDDDSENPIAIPEEEEEQDESEINPEDL
jgi:hypothetical protein